jgi:hypothetical protein
MYFERRNIMQLSKLIAPICLVALGAVGLGAQTAEVTRQTKIEVKDGKDVTVTGCLERGANGTYMLTDLAGDRAPRYVLVTDKDFSNDLGRRVEVKGTASDLGDGKVKVETKVKTSGGKETEATTESKGTVGGVPYLGVKSMKSFAEVCR